MPRFYIPPEQILEQRFSLTGSEAHHAVRVLRKKVGDSIDLFDGKDHSYRGLIEVIQNDEIRGTLVELAPKQGDRTVELRLYPALIKATKWDWLLEKACEIGVTRLTPLAAARSVVKINPEEYPDKVERWRRIALSASKQCGRNDVMAIDEPQTLSQILHEDHAQALLLIASEKENNVTIREASGSYKGNKIEILVGPEGGWEPSELHQVAKAGVRSVRLGPTLLRSETAGLVACTLALAAFDVY